LFIDTCQGDSGGPLMYYSELYQQWMLAGVTSFGRGCGLPDYAGIYTRATMYIDWIKSTVGKDGVVIAGENSANIGTMSNMLFIVLLSCLVLIRSFQ
jgi:secreted trypsin-like serine protease